MTMAMYDHVWLSSETPTILFPKQRWLRGDWHQRSVPTCASSRGRWPTCRRTLRRKCKRCSTPSTKSATGQQDMRLEHVERVMKKMDSHEVQGSQDTRWLERSIVCVKPNNWFMIEVVPPGKPLENGGSMINIQLIFIYICAHYGIIVCRVPLGNQSTM